MAVLLVRNCRRFFVIGLFGIAPAARPLIMRVSAWGKCGSGAYFSAESALPAKSRTPLHPLLHDEAERLGMGLSICRSIIEADGAAYGDRQPALAARIALISPAGRPTVARRHRYEGIAPDPPLQAIVN